MHWSSVGAANAEDFELMQYAREHGLVIFTQDLDFGTILAMQHFERPSVVQLRVQDSMPEACGLLVVRALAVTAESLHVGALVTIDAYQHRIRMLPFPR